MSQRGVDAALPAAFLAFGHEEASGVRPEAQAMDAGAAGGRLKDLNRRPARFSGKARRLRPPPPPAHALAPKRRPYSATATGRRQDDAP